MAGPRRSQAVQLTCRALRQEQGCTGAGGSAPSPRLLGMFPVLCERAATLQPGTAAALVLTAVSGWSTHPQGTGGSLENRAATARGAKRVKCQALQLLITLWSKIFLMKPGGPQASSSIFLFLLLSEGTGWRREREGEEKSKHFSLSFLF